MAVSKAQQKAVTKYVKSKYDRFGLTMPKGNLDTIKAHAAAQGESVNSFINRAIDQTMAQETVGNPTNYVSAVVVSLPYEDDKRAPAASDGRTEGKVEE